VVIKLLIQGFLFSRSSIYQLPFSPVAFTQFSKAFGVEGYEYTNIKSLETANGKFKNFHL